MAHRRPMNGGAGEATGPFSRPDADLLALLEAARIGDASALEGLLTELYPAIRMHAFRRLRGLRDPESLADDVAQESLLRIVRGVALCRAETPAALFGWALVVTRRVVADLLESKHRQEAWVRPTPDLEAVDGHASLRAWFSRSSPPPSEALTILTDLLGSVLQSLPEGTVAILHLRVQMEMTWPEIASQVRTTAAAAKRRFQRAQERIRKDILAQALRLPPAERRTVSRPLRRLGIALPLADPSDPGP